MKAKWENERPTKCPVYGLYKRIGFMRLRLLCYFLNQENGLEMARYLGNGYAIKECKMP